MTTQVVEVKQQWQLWPAFLWHFSDVNWMTNSRIFIISFIVAEVQSVHFQACIQWGCSRTDPSLVWSNSYQCSDVLSCYTVAFHLTPTGTVPSSPCSIVCFMHRLQARPHEGIGQTMTKFCASEVDSESQLSNKKGRIPFQSMGASGSFPAAIPTILFHMQINFYV